MEGILAWLVSESPDSNLILPMRLFLQWGVDQEMIDRISSTDCTDFTRLTVLNQLARFGMFKSDEKIHTEKLILRMALAQSFPDVNAVLDQKSSNLTYSQFLDLILKHAVQHDLVDLAASSNLRDVVYDEDSPSWLKLLEAHAKAGQHSDVALAVQETTRYLASLVSVEQSLYLKHHPLVAIVTDILDKNQNVCQMYSHVSPLLAASVPTKPPGQDVTLYSLLAHTVSFHTDNIFQHQLNKRKTNHLPDFSSEKLSLHHGIHHSLGFNEFLKQGRPASAVTFLLQKGRHSVRRKAVVNSAHGLALYNALDSTVTNACVVFAELLGQDSTLLRTHIATAMALGKTHTEDKLKSQLLQLVQGKEEGAAKLLAELEDSLFSSWLSDQSSQLSCLQQCHLAVRLSTCHSLPPPEVLLRYSLNTDDWTLFILAAQLFQFPLQMVKKICRSWSQHTISKHLFQALSRNQTEDFLYVFDHHIPAFLTSEHNSNDSLQLKIFFLQLYHQLPPFFCPSSAPKEGMFPSSRDESPKTQVLSKISLAQQELSEEEAQLTVLFLHPLCDVSDQRFCLTSTGFIIPANLPSLHIHNFCNSFCFINSVLYLDVKLILMFLRFLIDGHYTNCNVK
ncbi:Spg11p [Homalodisca vitripennis]|nr:Spg11p [Homalodisca vitripennis]